MADDFSANTSTTSALTVGTFTSGRVGERGDVDWHAVTLTAGTTYRIDIEAASLINPRLAGVYDSTGAFISGTTREGGGSSLDARGFFTPAMDGVYYIAADSNDRYADTGNYRVRITDNWDDYSSGTDTTGVLIDAFGQGSQSGFGTFDWAGDIDWFAFEAEAGQGYKIQVAGTFRDSPLADGFLYGVYDSDGTYVAQTRDADSGGFAGSAESAFVATTTGTYYVAAGAEGRTAPGRTYAVAVIADDYSQGPERAGSLVLDIPTDGRLETNKDRDWFEVTLEEGETYNISVSGNSFSVLEIHSVRNADGIRFDGVSADQDFPYENLVDLTFTAPETGTYYVDVTGSRGWWHTEGSYQVEVTLDDYAADVTTKGFVKVGSSTRGNLQFRGDSDWIAVDLMAGSLYEIEMKGASSDSGSLYNPYLYSLRDSTGAHIAGSSNDNAGLGLDARSFVRIEETGTYYIDARTTGRQSGSGYTVAVSEVPDDFAGDADTTGTLAAMTPATGRIEYLLDTDWFAASVEAGQEYRINISSDARDTAAPFFLGGVKTEAGAGAGSLINAGPDATGGREYYFTPDVDGTAFVEVRGNPAEGQRGYTLTLTERIAVTGTDGDDFLTLGGAALRDVSEVSGGNGTDMISFDGAPQGVVIDLAQDRAVAQGITLPLSSIENATGTSFADVFFGSDQAETFRGLGGDDLFYGSDGGRDIYIGGAGRDTVTYAGAREGVEASLLRERGGAGLAQDDLLRGIENLTGTAHDDMLTGDNGRNFLFGESGDDTIVGNGGDDYILAGFGTDVIIFSGNRADYTVTQSGIRTDVIDNTGTDGHDILGHAEILRFADGDVLTADLLLL